MQCAQNRTFCQITSDFVMLLKLHWLILLGLVLLHWLILLGLVFAGGLICSVNVLYMELSYTN